MLSENINTDIIYSPAAILNLFNNAISINQIKKLIQIKGVFQSGKGANYNGYYYDSLKEESSDAQLTIITPALIRNRIAPNKTITVVGYISKKVVNIGSRIEIQLNVTDLVEQTHNKYSDEEIKAIEILQKKASTGYRDVQSWMKDRIINEIPFKIIILIGKTGIIDSDIKHQLKESIGFYDIVFQRINLTSEADLVSAFNNLGNSEYNIVVISRGGGENLEVFNKLPIVEASLQLKQLFITAIGHKDDITLLQKVADKAFITPSEFGQFLNDTYNQTIEEVENSKARLVASVTAQLKSNYDKQIANLNERIKALDELKSKSVSDLQKVYDEKILSLNKQIEIVTNNYNEQLEKTKQLQEEKVSILNQQILSLNQQSKSKDDLLLSYKSQISNLESKSSFSWAAIIIGLIIGLILGLAMKR